MVTQDELQKLMTENLKIYFDDCFLATDQLTTATTQTGDVSLGLQNAVLNTGVQEGSTARLNYNRAMFNPLYSKLYFKLRLNSMDDVFMFAGLTTTLADPEWPKDLPMPGWAKHSYTGIMLHQEIVKLKKIVNFYFVTGNVITKVPDVGLPRPKNYQLTPIADIDPTRWLIFKIEGHKFSWYSLPYTVPYFSKNVLPGLKRGRVRVWSHVYNNSTAIPDDVVHYLTFFIKNEVGASKQLTLQRINYAEVYPD